MSAVVAVSGEKAQPRARRVRWDWLLLAPLLLLIAAIWIMLMRLEPTADANTLAITVKSSNRFHSSRLSTMLDTWWNGNENEVYVVTDGSPDETTARLNGRAVLTKCGSDHSRKSLSCKMQEELNLMLHINAKWSCHFDDDSYVNVDVLLASLARLDHRRSHYIGRTSTHPTTLAGQTFHFATGGAGICISRHLLHRLDAYVRGTRFIRTSERKGLPDDMTLGYIITNRLGVGLTEEHRLHSHLEQLNLLPVKSLAHQMSLSGSVSSGRPNVVALDPLDDSDKLRFKAIHCLIHSC